MKTMAVDQIESANDVLCGVCNESTSVEFHGPQVATLRANWELRSPPNGERYEIHLCEQCFFSVLADLRRKRMLITMFSDGGEDLSNFGRVADDQFQSAKQVDLLGYTAYNSPSSRSHRALECAVTRIVVKVTAMLSFFSRDNERDNICENFTGSKTLRMVGRGILKQDPSEVYESENYKKAQRNAHLIVNR